MPARERGRFNASSRGVTRVPSQKFMVETAKINMLAPLAEPVRYSFLFAVWNSSNGSVRTTLSFILRFALRVNHEVLTTTDSRKSSTGESTVHPANWVDWWGGVVFYYSPGPVRLLPAFLIRPRAILSHILSGHF